MLPAGLPTTPTAPWTANLSLFAGGPRTYLRKPRRSSASAANRRGFRPRAFERWRRQGRQTCIYSSGSVLAQQLLFRTTPAGDLTVYLAHFFDTKIGIKTDAESYRKITAALASPQRSVLFISDAIKELDAAQAAGMQTALCVRSEGDKSVPSRHPVIRTFDEVFP